MKNYKHILFDLDGTLTDSQPGIFSSLKYSLRYFGINEDSEERLRRMIGPPLAQSFTEFYGFDTKKAQEALIKYREVYSVTGIYENSVYKGIPRLLDSLRSAGMNLILATSKPESFAIRVIEHFDLYKYFSYISAGDMEQRHSEKADIIRKAITANNTTNTKNAIMIGDRRFDINGAAVCGIDSVGVLYGYGSREELTQAGATYIAEKVEDISSILL